MDLGQLKVADAAAKGATMTVKHPVESRALESDGRKMTVTTIGSDADEYQNNLDAMEDRIVDLIREHGSISRQKKEAESLSITVAALKDWELFVNGEWLQFSPDKALELLSDSNYKWLRGQIVRFQEDRSNFLSV